MSVAKPKTARPRVDPAAFPSMGPGQLRPGRDGDAIDDLLPQAVITAREAAHVVATIEEARSRRFGVVTSGGGTLLHIGALPRAYDIKLSMTAIGNILEQNPEDMTVTCEAGVSMSRLQRALARTGQRLAIDVAAEDRASIGGIVATNTSGGLRHGFGLPRDLVLGLTAIDGCGRTIQAGGRVVKNVAGYDLVRLLAGSWGGLAVLTQLTLRTHPVPAAGATLVFEFLSPDELDAARARLMAEPLPLAALDFAVDPSGATAVWMLVVRVEGTEEEVAFQGDRLCALAGREPADALEDWVSPAWIDDGTGATVKVSAPPADLVGVVRGVLEKLKATGSRLSHAPLAVAGHLGAGIARFHLGVERTGEASSPVDATALAALWAATEPAKGLRHRVLERGPASFKQTVEVWGPAPASLSLMRSLKRRLDPDDVLAPGRFVGGL
jgi:glycolate oxidase FAD binding subunit